MPELAEQMYCSQQIVVPPNFPYILKKYAKAAIKTQPYDLLRWSFEYFRALADRKTPPVKFRLEYPIFNTEGGLTRGYLKVLANQLEGMPEIPLKILRATWQGSCLDPHELLRILCLCEVYLREDSVPRLHFLAVAGGLLTKSLTHTMILLCETLTKEPDGGSAAIPVDTFLTMYQFLARMDASKDIKYVNGFREGETPEMTEVPEEEQSSESTLVVSDTEKLRKMSGMLSKDIGDDSKDKPKEEEKPQEVEELFKIIVQDEDGNEIPYEFYGEPKVKESSPDDEDEAAVADVVVEDENVDKEANKIALYIEESYREREERLADLTETLEAIAAIVDRYNVVNYDLGVIAGRQMSSTSGEFIAQHIIEQHIMDYINEQIAILPDPDLKKKKAKPDEVAMVRALLEAFIDENMDVIVPEVEEVEEEELPIPEILQVYAVPGIGPIVDEDIIKEFIEYALEACKPQADVFMPRNIRHFMCPPLEKFSDPAYYDDISKKSDGSDEDIVPREGSIID